MTEFAAQTLAQREPEKFGSYQDRINKLSEKLVGLHTGLESDRGQRFEHLNTQMKQLDERLATAQDASAKKFGVLKDQSNAFDAELNAEKNTREALSDEKT